MIDNQVLENLKDSSSDDMVNIQIEESLVRETLMAIDSANFSEDLLTLVCFGFVLILVLLTGYLGPQDVTINPTPVEFTGTSAIFERKLIFSDFSSLNNHILITLSLTPKNRSASDFLKTQFSYTVHCHNKQDLVRAENEKMQEYKVKYVEGDTQTAKIHLFNHTVITYDTLELTLMFDHASEVFSSFTIYFQTGSSDHTYFQIYFRIVFTTITFAFLVLLLFSLRKLEVKLWHLEQKMTVPLLLMLILYNNPLQVLHFYSPSIVLAIFDRLVYALYHAYLYFFILVLFDSLRYKNRKTDTCFFIPKVILCITLFILYAAHGIYDELHMYDEETGRDPTETSLSFAQLVCFLVFCAYSILSIVVSGVKVDVTERYKFNIYFSSGLITVIIMTIAQILFSMKFMYGSSLSFVLKFASENIFALLMAYFHWPYEVLQDQQYDGAQENQDAPEEFFVNENA